MIIELYKYSNLLRELVSRDIKKKYRRSLLGIFWSMLNPLLMMTITAMVFSQLFRFQIENYILYLISGQILFTFFSESTTFSMSSIIENGYLIKKVYVPKYIFPLSRVVSSNVNLLLTMPALLVIKLYTTGTITLNIFLSIIPLFLLFIFCLGIGLILSVLAVFFRDIFHLYGVLLTAMSYATPIFYPEDIIPQKFAWIVKYNPFYYYVKMFREIVYSNQIPELNFIILCAIISLITLFIGIFCYKKMQNQFILYV